MSQQAISVSPHQGLLRVIFVDDDQDILDGLERSLFTADEDRWEFEFANGGEEALELIEEEPFDVIVSDMRMPNMDGAELLKQVAEKHPSTLRIILSGHTEIEAAMRAISCCHQFLTKPTKADELLATIDCGLQLNAVVANPKVREAAGEVKFLPPRPAVYTKIVQLLNDEDSGLADVAKVVEQDIGVSTKLLHVSNNAFFNRGNKVNTISEAVTRVGPRVVRDVALSLGAFESFKDVSPRAIDHLTNHSYQVATIARELVEGKEDKELAFTAGLVHDVGRLVQFWKHPDASKQIAKLIRDGMQPREAEMKTMEVTHEALGAYLLSLWALPFPVIEAVLHHHQPGPALQSKIAWAVCAADTALSALATDDHDREQLAEDALLASDIGGEMYEKALALAQSDDLISGVAA